MLVAHEIDHVIAEKHGGQTDKDNLALACTLFNKYKGSDLAFIDPERVAERRLLYEAKVLKIPE